MSNPPPSAGRQLAEALDEVDRLASEVAAAKKRIQELEAARDHLLGVIERQLVEKQYLAERLLRMGGGDPT
jgi:hypothetical protein